MVCSNTVKSTAIKYGMSSYVMVYLVISQGNKKPAM